jgi:DNA-binding response OmpR family regulator
MKVLVLDDDDDLSGALCQILTARNIDVDCSASAPDAVELLKANHYDLVLLDYALPKHDGIWFMNNANLPRTTKVLLVTGHIERTMINTMFNMGACGYIIKPFNEEELIRNLNFFLPGRFSV